MEKEIYQLWARETAISTHDKSSARFESRYQSSLNKFESAFMYGRFQIDRHFHRLVSQLPQGARVLDVGCGTGNQVLHLQQLGLQAMGVEPSEEMRKFAEAKLPAGAIQNASILELPFPEGSFDFVYSIEVLRYLDSEDNIAGLREIRRVLKPGGTFFGTFVNFWALDGFSLVVGLRKLKKRWFGKNLTCHTEMTTPKKLRQLLFSAGFTEIEVHGAMIAPLRIVYKLSPWLGDKCARFLAPIDKVLTNGPLLRAFAGHLIAWAKK
jgi:ubiquinone/menaquinone biosynthesis C-methylase UbiE